MNDGGKSQLRHNNMLRHDDSIERAKAWAKEFNEYFEYRVVDLWERGYTPYYFHRVVLSAYLDHKL